jgi:hypothetical protein
MVIAKVVVAGTPYARVLSFIEIPRVGEFVSIPVMQDGVEKMDRRQVQMVDHVTGDPGDNIPPPLVQITL